MRVLTRSNNIYNITWTPGPEVIPQADLALYQPGSGRYGMFEEPKNLNTFTSDPKPRCPGDLVIIIAPLRDLTGALRILVNKALKIITYEQARATAIVEAPSGYRFEVPKVVLSHPLKLWPLIIPEAMFKPPSEDLPLIGRAWLTDSGLTVPRYRFQTYAPRTGWYVTKNELTEVDLVHPGILVPGDLVAQVQGSFATHINRVFEVASMPQERPGDQTVRVRRNTNRWDDFFLPLSTIKKVIINQAPEVPSEAPSKPKKFFYEEITTPWWYAARTNTNIWRPSQTIRLEDGSFLVVVPLREAPKVKKTFKRIQLIETFAGRTIKGITFTRGPGPSIFRLYLEGSWNKNIWNFVRGGNLRRIWFGPLDETGERLNCYWKGQLCLEGTKISKDFIEQLLRRCPYEAHQ